MRALVFMTEPEEVEAPGADAPRLLQNLASTPMKVEEVPDPKILADDWVVLRTRLCGICGSDSKQVLMDFDDAADNPMTSLISFPQVLGHEVVADVVEVGREVRQVRPGQRVVLNPWLSCGPRGINPPCVACQNGYYSACHHFTDGQLAPGIHTGNSSDATGGFAEYLPACESMVFPVPDDIPDEIAVLADPFSVSLHGVTRNPPRSEDYVLIYGAGALGTTANAIVHALWPHAEVGVVARFDAQADFARRLGARVFAPEPRDQLIDEIAAWTGARVRHGWEGLPMLYPGGVDALYDTVGAPSTLEVDLRVLDHGKTLVQLGVSSPARFEWTPWYFKELHLVGSNAFGFEEVAGVRQHAIQHYLDMVTMGSVDLSGMVTHRFRLDDWRDAFRTIVEQGETGAIKVAFDFR